MKTKFWLIQRGQFNNLQATGFLGGVSDRLVNPDYMGAAEFEWGAIPKAYRRIMGQFAKYSLHVTDLVTTGGVPFCVYCQDEYYEEILAAIKEYLDKKYQLKEWTNMHGHFRPLPTNPTQFDIDDRKYECRTNFWWCIDVASSEYNHIGDWIAFTGAADRQNSFKRIIQADHTDWWNKMTPEEQQVKFDEAFRPY